MFSDVCFYPVRARCLLGHENHVCAQCDFRFKMEQRANVKFCVKLGKSFTETLQMLRQAYGEQAMSRTQVYDWHRRFKNGEESVEDGRFRSGRPTTSRTDENIARVREVIRADRRQTIDEVASVVGISHGTCHAILTENLNMHRVCAHMVPKMLTSEQREERALRSGELIDMVDRDPDLLNRVITGDETWCYLYDPLPKRRSSEWKSPQSPRKQKFRLNRSKGKVMLEVFFDCKGIVHYEFIPQGRTVNKDMYVDILKRLREAVRQKRPELWGAKNWILHHDNAPAHRSLLVGQYLAKHQLPVLPQPPYSPDLAPADFYLFPRLKDQLKGRRFESAEEVEAATKDAMRGVSKNGFQECFQQWYGRWQKCVVAEGHYFEGGSM